MSNFLQAKMLKMMLLVLCALLCFARSQDCNGCPSGFTKVNQKCYKLYTEKKSWDDASKVCGEQDAHLIFMKQGDNVAELKKILETGAGCTSPHVKGLVAWTAGKRTISKGFVWEGPNKSQRQMCYTNWRQGEPNNLQGIENCVHIHNDFTWNDAPCNIPYCFFCEADI